jgi:hypothetical protein
VYQGKEKNLLNDIKNWIMKYEENQDSFACLRSSKGKLRKKGGINM